MYLAVLLYRVYQEERSTFWEGIVSVILSKTSVYVHVSYFERFRESAISLHSSKTVDKKEMLHTVSNIDICFSNDKGVTAYLA
jgi:hypothetical protein